MYSIGRRKSGWFRRHRGYCWISSILQMLEIKKCKYRERFFFWIFNVLWLKSRYQTSVVHNIFEWEIDVVNDYTLSVIHLSNGCKNKYCNCTVIIQIRFITDFRHLTAMLCALIYLFFQTYCFLTVAILRW